MFSESKSTLGKTKLTFPSGSDIECIMLSTFGVLINLIDSLRSRRLEVAGERENGRARGRHACLLLARPFFLVPTTSKRLLRRLPYWFLSIISNLFLLDQKEDVHNSFLKSLGGQWKSWIMTGLTRLPFRIDWTLVSLSFLVLSVRVCHNMLIRL